MIDRDPRYGRAKWRKLARAIIRRHPICRVTPGCNRPSEAADHITPVGPRTTNREFYDPRGIRGACRICNLARGWAVKLDSKLPPAPSAIVRKDYSRRD